jgi:hypothetical protein
LLPQVLARLTPMRVVLSRLARLQLLLERLLQQQALQSLSSCLLLRNLRKNSIQQQGSFPARQYQVLVFCWSK